MHLNWGTCGNNKAWCGFLTIDLGDPYFNGKRGVYIIWQANGPIIRVGQGVIRDRLQEHRKNMYITAYNNLLITWAVVPAQYLDGVERFLGNRLGPVFGNTFPDVSPISVNLPWKDF